MLGIVAALCFILGAGAVTTVNGQAASATNFKLAPNASIRLNEGSTGIRFTATMDTYDESATYGFVIVPAVYLNGITDNYVPALEAKYDTLINLKSNVVESKDGGYEIKGSIANIKYNNIDLDFVGIAYEKDANGNYAYAEFESVDAVARSVFNVASKAFNANQDSTHPDYGIYDEEEIGIITNFIDKGVAKKCGVSEEVFNSGVNDGYDYKLAFASDTLNANFGEATKFAFSSDTNLDTDTVTYLYNEEEVIVDAKNKTVTPLVTGSISIMATTVARIAEMQINVTVPEGYLATFDNELYTQMITQPSPREYYFEGGIKTEYLENFQGEKGVVKVTGKVNGGNGSGYIKLALPINHRGMYTIKFMVAKTELNPGLIGFMDYNGSKYDRVNGSFWYSENVPTSGVWYTKTVTVTGNTDAVYFEAGNGQNSYLEVYFAFIMDGDKTSEVVAADKAVLANTLEVNEIANFDSGLYLGFLSKPDANIVKNYSADIVKNKTDSLGSVRENALMLKGTFSSSWNFVVLSLPKTHSGSITIEFMVPETITDPVAFTDKTGGDGNGNLSFYYKTYQSGAQNYYSVGTWNRKTINISGDAYADSIAIGTVNQTAGNFEIYISGIWDASQTAIAEDLAKAATTLEGNEIADFDNEAYANLFITAKTNPALYYDAEILTSVELGGQTRTGVLKLTIYLSKTHNWSVVNMILPKAHTGSYTVEYYVDAKPNGGSLFANDGCSKFQYGGISAGSWGKLVVPSNNATAGNIIGIGAANHTKDGEVFTIYIDCIYDGTVA